MTSEPLPLTPAQHQILTLLATGMTVSAAAEKVGIHRNTVANWRKSSPLFRREFQALHYEQALYWRDALQAFAPLALETLRYAMANMNTPPGVRVRAALAILDKMTALPPADPDPDPAHPVAMDQPVAPAQSENAAESASAQPGPQIVPGLAAMSTPKIALMQNPKSAKRAQVCTIDNTKRSPFRRPLAA